MKPTVFFSYSRQDSEFALKLGRDLRAAGIAIWLDQLDIQPGERWDASVEKALAECSRILVILTPVSVGSTNVMDEVSYALEESKTVVPILHQDCEIPFRLRRLQHTDFRSDYQSGLEKLLHYLNVAQPETGKTDSPVDEPIVRARSGGGRTASSADASDRAGRSEATVASAAPKSRTLMVVSAAAIVVVGSWIAFKLMSSTSDVAQATEPAKPTAPAADPPKAKPAPSATQPTPPAVRPIGNEARIRIVNVNSQLCLTIAGGGTDRNTQLVQYPCDDDPSRFWSAQVVPDTDMFTIRNLNSGLCMTIAGGSTDRNLPAVQYPCDGDPSRNWKLRKVEGNTYRLVNAHSELCLTIAGGVTDRNAVAVQYLCDGDPSRDWQIRRQTQ